MEAAGDAAEAVTKRSNLFLIVADDLGYSDIVASGSEIATLNIYRLARGVAQFTSFYASPFCSPSRTMLMSGNDNHLAGLEDMTEALIAQQRGKPVTRAT